MYQQDRRPTFRAPRMSEVRLSPTIMASAGAQCDHLEHVATQIPYVLTVAGVCVVGFIVAGFVQNVYITWAVSFALMLCVLFVIRSMERRKAA